MSLFDDTIPMNPEIQLREPFSPPIVDISASGKPQVLQWPIRPSGTSVVEKVTDGHDACTVVAVQCARVKCDVAEL